MSDLYGRRNVLLLSYFVSAVSYFALSLSWIGGMLVLSRIFSGGLVPVCLGHSVVTK